MIIHFCHGKQIITAMQINPTQLTFYSTSKVPPSVLLSLVKYLSTHLNKWDICTNSELPNSRTHSLVSSVESQHVQSLPHVHLAFEGLITRTLLVTILGLIKEYQKSSSMRENYQKMIVTRWEKILTATGFISAQPYQKMRYLSNRAIDQLVSDTDIKNQLTQPTAFNTHHIINMLRKNADMYLIKDVSKWGVADLQALTCNKVKLEVASQTGYDKVMKHPTIAGPLMVSSLATLGLIASLLTKWCLLRRASQQAAPHASQRTKKLNIKQIQVQPALK